MNGNVSEASIEAMMKALAQAPKITGDDLNKSTFSQSNSPTTGLTYYDLEAGAKLLYPVLTPLRNSTPRVGSGKGTQANWKAITSINPTGVRMGVSGGNRGAVIPVNVEEYSAAYKGLGVESNVDFEAQYAANGFEDVKALAAKMGLESLMLGEELTILGGNSGVALGTTPNPSVTVSSTGGTLSATQYVTCVALTLEGHVYSSVSGGIPASLTRTNADGSTDTFGGGSAQKSSAVTATISSGSTNSIACTVTAVRAAVAYAWFWGTSPTNGTLGAITTTNRYTIKAAATGTQVISSLPSSDNSTNNLIFDGLLTQAMRSSSNAYYNSLDGATLTTDNAGGVVEIDLALQTMWDNYRLSPDTIWVSSSQALSISQKILATNSTGAYRIVVNQNQGMIIGGAMVAAYLNRFSLNGANQIAVRIHPNMPAGMVFMTTSSLPYPVSGVGNVWQIKTRQEYYQIEWPVRTRRYEYGVYVDEVLQHYFPPSMGIIANIG